MWYPQTPKSSKWSLDPLKQIKTEAHFKPIPYISLPVSVSAVVFMQPKHLTNSSDFRGVPRAISFCGSRKPILNWVCSYPKYDLQYSWGWHRPGPDLGLIHARVDCLLPKTCFHLCFQTFPIRRISEFRDTTGSWLGQTGFNGEPEDSQKVLAFYSDHHFSPQCDVFGRGDIAYRKKPQKQLIRSAF